MKNEYAPTCSPAPKFATLTIAASLWLGAMQGASAVDPLPLPVASGFTVTQLTPTFNQPIAMAFINGANDFFVLEKASGQVKRVLNGNASVALDLAVNSAGHRGLLSIALHPSFPTVPQVYLAYTESLSGVDSTVLSDVPLLGNRVDRFIWNGSTLNFDRNILRYRARQDDNVAVSGHPGTQNATEGASNNGGTIRFGADGKLYVFVGDVGRRGWLQNLPNGPFTTSLQADDQYGGPAPDNAHLAGVLLRLNNDGTTPADNPFFAAGTAIGGEIGSNIQKIYSYGHRNSFGMAFDPLAPGRLWLTENGDDTFTELNRVTPGMNGGWIQIAGPAARMSEYKYIETTQFGGSLSQLRYPPTRLAYTSTLAQARLFMLPGATYVDPELSWKYEIAPAGATFIASERFGPDLGTLWFGSGKDQQNGDSGGSLYRVKLTADRLHVDVSATPQLADKVADNIAKYDLTESQSLRIGTGFGVTPDIVQGTDGAVYVVSLSAGVIYRVAPVTP